MQVTALILLVVVAAVFGRAIGNDFVELDDRNEVIENPDFNPVTVSGLMWNWSNTRLTLYMPLTYTTWGTVAAVSPRTAAGVLRPWPFHALNVVLHAANVLLLLVLLRRLGFSTIAAFGGSLMFAVHPLVVEPVAWVSGMYTLLSTALSLGALIAYVRHAQRQRDYPMSIHRRWFWVATVLFAAALLCKAAAVSTVAMAAVLDRLIVGRKPIRVARSLWFWVLMAVPVIVMAKSFQDFSGVPIPPWWGRPVVALDAAAFYLRKIVWPVGLSPDYGRNPRWVADHFHAALAWSVVVAIVLVGTLSMWKRRPRIVAGVGLSAAGCGPYLGLTAFDFQYLSTVADRYAYTGLIGVAVIVASALNPSPSPGTPGEGGGEGASTVESLGLAKQTGIRIHPHPNPLPEYRERGQALVILACAVLAVLSFRQVGYWRNSYALFDHAEAVNPDSLLANGVKGYLAAKENRPADAEAYFKKALTIWPQDATIHYTLGNLYLRQKRYDDAIAAYRRAVYYRPKMVMFRDNLAAALAYSGRRDQAWDEYTAVLKIDPQDRAALDGLATLKRQAHQ